MARVPKNISAAFRGRKDGICYICAEICVFLLEYDIFVLKLVFYCWNMLY
jgi:hypothetical protein